MEYVESDTITFTTLSREFEVTTGSASSVTEESATINGSLTELEGYDTAEVWFEWRETGASEWVETEPDERVSTGSFDHDLEGLEFETEYEFRSQGSAETSDGEHSATSTGDTVTFETDPEPLPEWQTHTAAEGTAEESTIHVYEADDPGPVTLALNIHADEREAIDALEDIQQNWTYPVHSGTLLVWPAPCPSAYDAETQLCNDSDLNESFDLVDGPQTTVAQTIEDELLDWDVDHVLDLHTRPTLFENGGEANAVFPSDDTDTRPVSNAVADHINANYAFETEEEWQVGNTVDEANAENDGMLVTYAWEEHAINGQIGISWEPWNESEQVEQHQRIVAKTLDELGYDLGDDAQTLVDQPAE